MKIHRNTNVLPAGLTAGDVHYVEKDNGVFLYVIDNDGNAVEVVHPIFTWDQLSEWATANSTNTAYAYNADGQITIVTRTVPTGSVVTTFGYTDGRVTTKTLSGDFPSHAAAGINLVQTLTYNADGEITNKG